MSPGKEHKVSISVVVTCYNYGKYLERCLNSVLAQTYKDYEIIVINDGSTDNTDEVVAPYLSNPNLKYIKQDNTGQTVAKNNGITHASGEFIAFLDADDLWEKDKLEKQIILFKDPEVGVVYSGFTQIGENDEPAYIFVPSLKHRGIVTEQLLFNNFVCFSSSVVRKSVLDEMGHFDEILAMGIDWDLWLRVSIKYKFDYVDEDLVLHRVGHPLQMSKNAEKRFECGDLIKNKFFSANPMFGWIKKDVMANSYIRRAAFYSRLSSETSWEYFRKAISLKPFSLRMYSIFFKANIAALINSPNR